ncbi:hypothetical protein RN001_010049 [Aquatica leii]|uniref:Uncharacterized protein n=1 Tax=Aquatica leii TaxID=1421715 RepID=A0AAN7SN54_9COLE|nr:hypothetical protein RN001_010049 [Aquatica leii]
MNNQAFLIILLLIGTINISIVPTDARDYICALGGSLGCKFSCLPENDDFDGYCDKKDNCICAPKPKKPKNGTQ